MKFGAHIMYIAGQSLIKYFKIKITIQYFQKLHKNLLIKSIKQNSSFHKYTYGKSFICFAGLNIIHHQDYFYIHIA